MRQDYPIFTASKNYFASLQKHLLFTVRRRRTSCVAARCMAVLHPRCLGMLLMTKTINHAATTRYLQPRRLQVLLFICHQKALTLPVCSLPFNFSTLQQEMSSCLPVPCATGGRCACARVVTRVHVCCGCHGQTCVCTDTPVCVWCGQLGRRPSRQGCCPHPALAQALSLSQPRA